MSTSHTILFVILSRHQFPSLCIYKAACFGSNALTTNTNELSAQERLIMTTVDTVKTNLQYFVPPADGSKPWHYINADLASGQRQTNYTTQPYEMEIENLRGKEDSVTLDTAGFLYAKNEAKHKSFKDDKEVENEYYPESIELIKKLTGASRVVLFDHSPSFVNILIWHELILFGAIQLSVVAARVKLMTAQLSVSQFRSSMSTKRGPQRSRACTDTFRRLTHRHFSRAASRSLTFGAQSVTRQLITRSPCVTIAPSTTRRILYRAR